MLIRRKHSRKMFVKPTSCGNLCNVVLLLLFAVTIIYLIACSTIRLSLKFSTLPKTIPHSKLSNKLAEPNDFKIVQRDKNVPDIAIRAAEPQQLVHKELGAQRQLFRPKMIRLKKHSCSSSQRCAISGTEINFKVASGAASVIGPLICVNNTALMSNSLNNVGRGMNIAVLDGTTGKALRHAVFDVYQQDSNEFKTFLSKLKDDEIFIIATADDASRNLDNDVRNMLSSFGSTFASSLAFRDSWVFVGGLIMDQPRWFESIVSNSNVEKNKYGEWPARASLEGCLPILPKA